MKWLTDDLKEKLLENGCRKSECEKNNEAYDLVPLVYLRFAEFRGWLLASLSPDDPDVAFGLCQVAESEPKLGNVRLTDLDELRDSKGQGVREEPLFRGADPLTLSQYGQLARTHKAIALRYTDSTKRSIRTVAPSVRDGLAGTFTIMADPAGAAEGRKHHEEYLRRVEAKMAKLSAPRVRKRTENDGQRFERVIIPVRGQPSPSEPSEFEVCVQVGKQITIRKDGDEREQTFIIGDHAEYYPYWNYRTHDKILAITAKTIRIARHGKRTSRQTLYEFCRCNFGFDQRQAYKREAEDSFYR